MIGMGIGLGGSSAPRRHVSMMRRRITIAISASVLVFLSLWQAPIRIKTESVKIEAPKAVERK
ncbi:MAG: hypothetical protein LBL52_01555 [Rickettsiales bacterium]|jgi:hypothetical protein|nr:hypothetical protein [Rickettsiales bacterium]